MSNPADIEKNLSAIAAYMRLIPGTTATVKWPESIPRVWQLHITQGDKQAVICYAEAGQIYVVSYDVTMDNIMIPTAHGEGTYQQPYEAVGQVLKAFGLQA